MKGLVTTTPGPSLAKAGRDNEGIGYNHPRPLLG